jgi:glutathione peroxidase
MSASALYELPVHTITGEGTTLAEYRGKVLLIVNVASKCGLTPQYDGLEKLYSRFKDSGFVVLGFPANDFAEQEPGSNEEIASFCRMTFAVDFPMFSKIKVTGPEKDPLYAALCAAKPEAFTPNPGAMRQNLKGFLNPKGLDTTEAPEVLWNFEKFLVDREGNVVARFSPEVTPDDPLVVAAVEAAL